LNRLTLLVLNNAAGAMAGMVTMDAPDQQPRSTVGLTMFGVTTPAAKAIRAALEEQGFEVLVFHATGTGGRAMESLINQGIIKGVIDLTTTEIADAVVGGVLSAGMERLSAGVACRIPQVIAPGALDMVNFGPKETVPREFQSRKLYVHNPQVTLMRTTAEENRRFAEFMATKLAHADSALVSLCLPLAGVSMIDKKGAVFFDPEADRVFREVLKEKLNEALTIVEVDANINDEAFTNEVVSQFLTIWERHQDLNQGG
jgi:uncharacterized protein (UPF0261 family)